MTDRDRHDEERRQALALLERAFGKDATIPLDVAAAVMPVLPEWRQARPRRRRGAAGRDGAR